MGRDNKTLKKCQMNDGGFSKDFGTVIELFGTPGIGKSYLAKGLVTQFRAGGKSVSDRSVVVGDMARFRRIIYKVSIIILMLVITPVRLRLLPGFILKAGVKRPMAFIQVLVNWLYIVALIRSEVRRYDIVILDQGIAQAVWSTIFRSDIANPDTSAKLMKYVLMACGIRQLVVVHLTLDLEKHRARLSSRLNGHSPLDDGDPVKFERGLLSEKVVGGVIEQLVSSRDCSKLRKLDFENDRSDNGYCLYESLLDQLYPV